MLAEKNKNHPLIYFHSLFTLIAVVIIACSTHIDESNFLEPVIFFLMISVGISGAGVALIQRKVLLPSSSLLVPIVLLLSYFIFRQYGNEYPMGNWFLCQQISLFFLIFGVMQCLNVPSFRSRMLFLIICVAIIQLFAGTYQAKVSMPYTKMQAESQPYSMDIHLNENQLEVFTQRLNSFLPFGSYLYPNAWAAICATGLILLFYFLFSHYRNVVGAKSTAKISALPLFFILLFSYGVILSDAKGVIISFVISMTTLFIYHRYLRFSSVRLWVFLGFSVLLLIILLPFIKEVVFSLKVRYEYWQAGWNMLSQKSKWLMGMGPTGFSDYYSMFKTTEGWEVTKPHSIFVFILVNYGLIGFVLSLCVLVGLIKTLHKKQHTEEVLEEDSEEHTGLYLKAFYGSFLIINLFTAVFSLVLQQFNLFHSLICIFWLGFILIKFILLKKSMVCFSFEKNSYVQILFLMVPFLTFFYGLLPTLFPMDMWFGKLSEFNDPLIFTITSVCLLSLSIIWKKYHVGFVPKEHHFAFCLFVFFILMISGDMVYHYLPFPVVFLCGFLCLLPTGTFKEKSGPSFVFGFFISVLLLSCVFFIYMIKPKFIEAYFFNSWQILKHDEELELTLKIQVLEKYRRKSPEPNLYNKELAYIYHDQALLFQDRGFLGHAKKMYRMTKQIYEEICLIEPRVPHIYDKRAELMSAFEKDRTDQILELRKKAISLYPLKARYHFKLGKWFVENGNTKEGSIYLKKALQLHELSDKRTRLTKEELSEVEKLKAIKQKELD